jgi:hypothetical protein
MVVLRGGGGWGCGEGRILATCDLERGRNIMMSFCVMFKFKNNADVINNKHFIYSKGT